MAMKLGFHVSISHGFEWTHREAKRLQCEAVQIFVKNPRSWVQKKWRDEDVEDFQRLFTGIPVFAHLTYLPNLARIDEDERHMKAFINEIELCLQLGIDSMVVHCGSREDKTRGIDSTASAINRALDKYGISLILETAAGQGNSLGVRLSELRMIHNKVIQKHKVSLCLDTSHIFQAGYDIRKRQVLNGLITAIEDWFGKDKIGLLHLNDSKTDLGSRVDRHWHIGDGMIGTQTFKFILNEIRFAGLCGIMETPKTGMMDEINMKLMRSLLSPLVPGSSA